MKSASSVGSRSPQAARPRRDAGEELRLPAGRARDRRDAAVADRPRDRLHHHRAVLRSRSSGPASAISTSSPRRPARSSRAGATKVDPAVRDRRGARHPRPRRPERQGRRRAGRTRSRPSTRPSASITRAISSAPSSTSRGCSAALSDGDPVAEFHPPAGAPGAGRACSAQFLDQTGRGASGQARRARPAAARRRRPSAPPPRRRSTSSKRSCRSSRSGSTSARRCSTTTLARRPNYLEIAAGARRERSRISWCRRSHLAGGRSGARGDRGAARPGGAEYPAHPVRRTGRGRAQGRRDFART